MEFKIYQDMKDKSTIALEDRVAEFFFQATKMSISFAVSIFKQSNSKVCNPVITGKVLSDFVVPCDVFGC